MTGRSPAWSVLLLGGASGTGKSSVARRLGLQLGLPWQQVDDLRLALERMGIVVPNPDLVPGDAGVGQLIDVAQLLMPAIAAVVENHVDRRDPLVLEGDGIHPELAMRTPLRERIAAGHLRIVFLVEDEEQLYANMRHRHRGIGAGPDDALMAHVQKNVLYGDWLVRAARRMRLPTVAARP